MSISGKALKLIQKSLPELHLCKSFLVLPPTEHLLRGFAFERTPYKGLFYFWRVIRPLYSTVPEVTLGYGEGLADSDYIDLSSSEMEASVRRLVDIIANQELDVLR